MATPYVRCEECRYLVKANVEGWYYTDDTQSVVKECHCHEEWRKENMRILVAKRSNVWTDKFTNENNPLVTYRGSKSPEIPKKIQHILNNIEKDTFKKASLYLYGGPRTQKTYIAQWMAYSLTMKGFSVFYERMPHFIAKGVNQSFDADKIQTTKKYIDELLAVDFLILDDFMMSERSSYYPSQIPHIDIFLRERLETLTKPIYFISDKKPMENKTVAFGEGTKALVDATIKKTNTYLYCQDNWDYIDDLADIFSKDFTYEKN